MIFQAAELNGILMKQILQLQEAIDHASEKVKDDSKHPLIVNSRELKSSLKTLQEGVHLPTLKVNFKEKFWLSSSVS